MHMYRGWVSDICNKDAVRRYRRRRFNTGMLLAGAVVNEQCGQRDTSRSIKLTWANRCTPCELPSWYDFWSSAFAQIESSRIISYRPSD